LAWAYSVTTPETFFDACLEDMPRGGLAVEGLLGQSERAPMPKPAFAHQAYHAVLSARAGFGVWE